jgi:hypothetical protein
MLIFKTLHILSMVTMITIFTGGEFLRLRDLETRRSGSGHRPSPRESEPGPDRRQCGPIRRDRVGVLTAATGGMDFVEGWLIAAYVLVAVFLVNANTLGLRLIRLADKAIEADEGKRPKEEVVQEMAASRAGLFFLVNAAIFAAIIADMVLKPF